ncbi:MFS transporter [Pseudoalteromonas luteoviolacea]|uniref:Major facilitator superfamily (MFS) profile domain-containing protein n=1 Tax=Pseudoalteromonas luteoviolacea H33 TaxID=1365251 RepID=A0A167ECL0_9GAMM|nr:MFS transporter [Pseudoalteromonas luteoviolacea]KZN50397.1 hypothetical protein N476_16250 [Pseudoalteromonas luteoviolacea H33]KZN77954.1 hypothetical protein N477_11215 [Pseudoalteromonas luteoviolacea H33-S]MBQ4879515.1 MFS transporter [Pseudoalteromonas luteoviolacea]MBQ4908558.1 MFS transporter [Pseudoalteromonas luteoviolacea]
MTQSQFATQYGIHLGLTMFACMLAMPIFTPYMLNLGFALQDIALAMMVMAVTIILIEVPSGMLADMLGRRKVFLFSLFFGALCNSILLFSEHLWHICAAMFFWGLSQATLSGTLNAWFVEKYQRLQGNAPINKGFAKVYGLSYLIGASAALCAALFLAFADAQVWSLTSLYQILFTSSICVFITVFIRTYFVVKETARASSAKSTNSLASQCLAIFKTCKQIEMRRLLIILIFAIPVASSIEKFWPALVENYSHAPVDTIAWLFPAMLAASFALNGLAAAISTQLCRLLNQRLGLVMALAHMAKLVCVLLLALASSIHMFLAALIFFYFCMGLAQPAQQQFQHQLSHDDVRASIESVTSLSTRLGGLLGTALTALMLSYTTLLSSWLALAVLSLVAIILCCTKRLNRAEPQQLQAMPS